MLVFVRLHVDLYSDYTFFFLFSVNVKKDTIARKKAWMARHLSKDQWGETKTWWTPCLPLHCIPASNGVSVKDHLLHACCFSFVVILIWTENIHTTFLSECKDEHYRQKEMQSTTLWSWQVIAEHALLPWNVFWCSKLLLKYLLIHCKVFTLTHSLSDCTNRHDTHTLTDRQLVYEHFLRVSPTTSEAQSVTSERDVSNKYI